MNMKVKNALVHDTFSGRAIVLIALSEDTEERWHSIRVGSMFSDDVVRAIGLLHEYTDYAKLDELGFTKDMIKTIKLLAEGKKSNYKNIDKIAEHPIAREVILASFLDDLSQLTYDPDEASENNKRGMEISQHILAIKTKINDEEASETRLKPKTN